MQILDRITPQLYAILKQNPQLINLARPLWKFLQSLTVGFRRLSNPSAFLPPPTEICYSVKDWVEAYSDSTDHKQANYLPIYPSQTIERKLPKTLDVNNLHWKFRVNQQRQISNTFVATIPHGRVWDNDKIITPDNQLLGELSVEASSKSDENSAIFPQTLPPIHQLSGTLAVLASPYGTGYYHWLCHTLPRLELLRKSGIALEEVDYFLVNRYVSRFQVESLTSLGIPRSKIIESQWYPHLQADKLIVTSLLEKIDHSPEWVCNFLRRSFLGSNVKQNKKQVRLYINRSQAVHRRVDNEPEIIEFLSKLGFINVTLESLSIKEQAELLAAAEVVVSPHGAGLTNLVFCQPNTKVIELLHPRSVVLLFWALSVQRQLDYYYLLSEGEIPPEGIDPFDNSINLKVNLDLLSQTLQLAAII